MMAKPTKTLEKALSNDTVFNGREPWERGYSLRTADVFPVEGMTGNTSAVRKLQA